MIPFKTYLQNVGGPISADIGDAGGGVFSGPAPPNPPITAYQTGAVSFDGTTTFLELASLASTNGPTLSFSVWFQYPIVPLLNGGSHIWDSNEVTIDGNNIIAGGTGTAGTLNANFGDSAGSQQCVASASFVVDESWHHYICSCDISGSGAFDAKLDGIDLSSSPFFSGLPATVQMNGLSLNIVAASDLFPSDPINIADFWLAPHQSLLTTGVISPTTLATFRNPVTGKPVNLGANGQTPTGITPAVFLRRAPGAAASTFATNLGTGGGPFTITGTLTSAPTSPTD